MAIYTFTKEKIDFLSEKNITAKIGSTVVSVGSQVTEYDTLTLTSKSDKFKRVNYLSKSGKEENFSYRTAGRVAYKKSYGAGDGTGEWIDIVITLDVVEPRKFEINSNDITRLNDNNVIGYINDVEIKLGDKFKDKDIIKCVAGEGKEFYQQSTSPETSCYLNFSQTGGRDYKLVFNYIDKKNVNITFNLSDLNDSENDTFSGLFPITTDSTDVTGNNNIYLIDSDKIVSINSERFVTSANGVEDYGKFILSLIKVPFKIPDELILSEENIRLANKQLNTKGNKIGKDVLEIKYCSIEVPLNVENSTSFINAIAILRLPRVDPINIDLNYVLGYKITVFYSLDLYTGNVNVNIKSSKTNETIASKNCNMGLNIPYGTSYNNGVIDNSNISISGDNGIKKAFIEIVKGDCVYNFFSCPVNDYGKIKDKGFFKISNYDIDGVINSEHIKDLIFQLKQGVIIK